MDKIKLLLVDTIVGQYNVQWGNDLTDDLYEVVIKLMKQSFEAGRQTCCATDKALYYEVFEDYLEELK